jgi:Flp pilus assembly protein TadG
MKVIRRFLLDDCGAAMVEFAIVFAFILVPLLFGAMEFGRGLYIKSTVTAAAREGVRYAIVHGASSGRTIADTTLIRQYITGRTALSPLIISTTYNPAGSLAAGSFVKVRVAYAYTPVVGNFSATLGGRTVTVPLLSARTIAGTSQQVIAY